MDVSEYKKNRDLLYGALTKLGFTCVRPQGAFYLFLKVPDGDDAAFCELAKTFDLLLVSAASFGMPGYMRIAYCVSEQTIRNALPAFEALARACRL